MSPQPKPRSLLREPSTLLRLLTEAWVAHDMPTIQHVMDVLAHESKGPGFVTRKPHRMAAQLDALMEDRLVKEHTDLKQSRADAEYGAVTEDSGWTSKIAPPGLIQRLVAKTLDGDLPERDPTLDELLAGQGRKVVKSPPPIVMTQGQSDAWDKLIVWLKDDYPFFVLKGFAGTGKSFLMKKLHELTAYNLYFTAPTNKATKVLSDFIGEQCRTTYSLLGLRMVEEDDKQVLSKSGRTPQLGPKPIIVIDEAGMIPRFMADLLKDLADNHGWRVIFVGDPAQLNPVKESRSVVWSFAERHYRALLTEVKRFDNQLLALSIKIRSRLKLKKYGTSPIKDDNDGKEGVFVMPRRQMMDMMKGLTIDDWKTTKVGCWRNKTVKQYNDWIRKNLGLEGEYAPGDLIMMAAPITDSEKRVIAFTDEEFQIRSIEDRTFEIEEGPIEARAITLYDSKIVLYVPKDQSHLNEILSRRANRASKCESHERKLLWQRFWNLKNQFHQIRHGFCLTSHRLQGSTLERIFVDQSDVLANPDEREAYRALYVLTTRPTKALYTF